MRETKESAGPVIEETYQTILPLESCVAMLPIAARRRCLARVDTQSESQPQPLPLPDKLIFK